MDEIKILASFVKSCWNQLKQCNVKRSEWKWESCEIGLRKLGKVNDSLIEDVFDDSRDWKIVWKWWGCPLERGLKMPFEED